MVLRVKIGCKKLMFLHFFDCHSLAGVRLQEIENQVSAIAWIIFIKRSMPSIHRVNKPINIFLIQGIRHITHQKFEG